MDSTNATNLCSNSATFNFTDVNTTSRALVSLYIGYDIYYTETYYLDFLMYANITD